MLRATVLAATLCLMWSGAARAVVVDVTIDNFTFSPMQVNVAAGTTVTWTNRDDIPHTVTGDSFPRMMRSPALDTGDYYSVIFGKPGTFGYFCALHPHMQGTVVVR